MESKAICCPKRQLATNVVVSVRFMSLWFCCTHDARNSFDVIFLMLDQTEERRDTMLARHLVSLYLSDEEANKRLRKSVVVSCCVNRLHIR